MNAFITCLFNETYKNILAWWYFRTNTFIRPLTMAMQFAGLMFVFYRGHVNGAGFSANLIAYCFWVLGFYLLADMSWNIIDEMQAGTLEQLYMTSMPIAFLWIARLLGSLVVASLNVALILVALSCIVGISIPVTPALLLVFISSLPSLFGLALFLGGLTFKIKRTEALVGLMHTGLIYLSGAIVPLTLFPERLRQFAYWVPGAPGIDLMRSTINENLAIKQLLFDGRIFIVLVHSLILCIVGAAFFKYSEKSLRSQGNYGIY